MSGWNHDLKDVPNAASEKTENPYRDAARHATVASAFDSLRTPGDEPPNRPVIVPSLFFSWIDSVDAVARTKEKTSKLAPARKPNAARSHDPRDTAEATGPGNSPPAIQSRYRIEHPDCSGGDGQKQQSGQQGKTTLCHPTKRLTENHEGPDREAKAEPDDQQAGEEVVAMRELDIEELGHTEHVDHQAEKKEATGEEKPRRSLPRVLECKRRERQCAEAEHQKQENQPGGASLYFKHPAAGLAPLLGGTRCPRRQYV